MTNYSNGYRRQDIWESPYLPRPEVMWDKEKMLTFLARLVFLVHANIYLKPEWGKDRHMPFPNRSMKVNETAYT